MRKKKANNLKCKACNKDLGKTLMRLRYNRKCDSWFHGTRKCTHLEQDALAPILENKVKRICESCCGSESDSEDEDLADLLDEDQQDEKIEAGRYEKGRVSNGSATNNLETKLDTILYRNKLILKKLDKIEKKNKQ
ncbi:hypothetical protein HHI36_013206 [Cryptolaemus montrouzieri]|uniref:Uncharacterized protein n=1 Tax=Cryptolaemus montrouzieri TaxID=559131 RepID=A0ABD2NHJ2_9CUCU